MSKQYPQRKSPRKKDWDYTSDGVYFITMCTKNQIHYFGSISNGKMELSEIGILADVFWYEIKNHAKNIELDEFIVMPNHIHGILILDGNDTAKALERDTAKACLSRTRFQNQGKNSVSSIIGSYKSAVSKHAHRLGFEFEWHGRFYDHIIRDQESFERIRNYIIQNPAKWNNDKFHN